MEKEMQQKTRFRNWITIIALLKFCLISLYLLQDSLIDVLSRFQQIFGTVSWLFAILMVALLAEALHLVFFRSCSAKNLDFIEAASPPVGLLGTVFALMGGFSNLNLGGMKLEDAITVIVLAIAVSLKTTAAGIINGLIAMTVRDRLMPVLHRKENHRPQKKEHAHNEKESKNIIGSSGRTIMPAAGWR